MVLRRSSIFHDFCLAVSLAIKRVVFSSSTMIVDLSIFLFNSVDFCNMCFEAPLLSEHTTLISVQRTDTFIILKYPSSAFLILSLKV